MRPFGNFATTDFHQIWSRNVLRCPVRKSRKTLSKMFNLGVICPQNLKSKIGQTGTSLRAGHVMHCREILFTPHCSPSTREFPSLDKQLFCKTYGCGATGHQSFQIFRFWPIFPYTKPLKRTFRTAQKLHRRILLSFPCGRRRSKGVPSCSGVFLRLLLKELGTPKLANIFAYVKWLYPYRMQLHGVSDLDQRCLKTRNSED